MKEREKRNTRTQVRKYRKKLLAIKIIRGIIILAIVAILAYMAYGIYQEMRIRTVSDGSKSVAEENKLESRKIAENQTVRERVTQNFFEPVVTEYKGYSVDCRLEVPKIDLETNILSEYTKEGLKICASKYYGPDANEVGNYCIAGHNYNEKNMFNHLIDLEVGDSVFLTDNVNGKVEYMIYDIYKVKPENVEALSQETEGEREITLITCVNYSKNRLVVKAVEKRTYAACSLFGDLNHYTVTKKEREFANVLQDNS